MSRIMKPLDEGNELLKKIDAKLEQEQKEVGGCVPLLNGSVSHPPQAMISEADIYKSATSQQDGDSWLFCQIYRDQLCFDHAAVKWYEWKGHYWEEDKVDEATRRLDAVIDVYAAEAGKWSFKKFQASQSGNMRDAEEFEKKEKEFQKKIASLQKRRWKEDVLKLSVAGANSLAITGEEWDKAPYLLPCKNGIIDLKTGTARPGKQADYIKNVCPTEWKGLHEPSPTWERFLHEIFDSSELVSFFQRLCGYALSGSNIKNAMPILWGKGRNGKTTLFEVLRVVLGTLAGPIQSEMLVDQKHFRSSATPNPDVVALRGMRLIWASETDEGQKLNVEKAKLLSGSDTLRGRELYGRRPVDFEPTHTLFLLTNHKPKINPNDYAIWKRVYLIPMLKSFVDDPVNENERKQDPTLPEKLKTEASGILAWLVRGFLEWQKTDLNPPAIVREATQEYREDEDIMGYFLRDCCIIDQFKQVSAADFYKAYTTWCSENGHRPITGTKFGRLMKERFEPIKTAICKLYRGVGLVER